MNISSAVLLRFLLRLHTNRNLIGSDLNELPKHPEYHFLAVFDPTENLVAEAAIVSHEIGKIQIIECLEAGFLSPPVNNIEPESGSKSGARGTEM